MATASRLPTTNSAGQPTSASRSRSESWASQVRGALAQPRAAGVAPAAGEREVGPGLRVGGGAGPAPGTSARGPGRLGGDGEVRVRGRRQPEQAERAGREVLPAGGVGLGGGAEGRADDDEADDLRAFCVRRLAAAEDAGGTLSGARERHAGGDVPAAAVAQHERASSTPSASVAWRKQRARVPVGPGRAVGLGDALAQGLEDQQVGDLEQGGVGGFWAESVAPRRTRGSARASAWWRSAILGAW